MLQCIISTFNEKSVYIIVYIALNLLGNAAISTVGWCFTLFCWHLWPRFFSTVRLIGKVCQMYYVLLFQHVSEETRVLAMRLVVLIQLETMESLELKVCICTWNLSWCTHWSRNLRTLSSHFYFLVYLSIPSLRYTPWVKKRATLFWTITRIPWQIFTIFAPVETERNTVHVDYKFFHFTPLILIPHYLVKLAWD